VQRAGDQAGQVSRPGLVDVIVRKLKVPGDRRAGGGELGRDTVLGTGGSAGQADQQHRLVLQRAGDQLRAERGGELAGVVDLVLQRLHLLGLVGALTLEGVDLLAQVGGDRPVERRGPDDDADGERQEHRDDGNQVIAEGDHENRSCIQLTKLFQVESKLFR
jgi:hypothetical protein